jgi:hypothetical protein
MAKKDHAEDRMTTGQVDLVKPLPSGKGYAPVESDCVLGATTVNLFERKVLPRASDEYRDISHLDEGLAGFFGRSGRSSNRDD